MILGALNDLHRRLEDEGEVPPYGYSKEKISYAIVLDRQGKVLDVQSLQSIENGKARPRSMDVPRAQKRTSKVVANFLWDNAKYVLGLDGRNSSGQWIRPKRGEHEAFKALHRRELEGCADPGLVAVREFLGRWNPSDIETLPHAEEMIGKNVVFCLGSVAERAHEREEARRIAGRLTDLKDERRGVCLVTGKNDEPIAELHDSVKGVAGAQSSGASLVSFNAPAFVSYGKEKGFNAPVSSRVASNIADALNFLLAHGSRRRVRIGDATTVFWAEAGPGAEKAEDLFAALLEPRSAEEEEAAVRDGLVAIATGRSVEEALPEFEVGARFFVLGLSGNAARLSVRFWLTDTLGVLAARIGQHWQDLRLVPDPWRGRLPAAWRLLALTAPPSGREKKPQPILSGSLLRAILQGTAYPASLLSETIQRLRAEPGTVDFGRRIGIVKACVARSRRLRHNIEEDTLVSLDRDTTDAAYNLGRLFAALVYAAEKVAPRSATLRERYMASASATPRVVFPHLLRNFEHNRSALGKSGGFAGASRVRVDQAVGQIMSRLPRDLPAVLDLDGQGRFFVGFHHQHQSFFVKSDSAEGSDDDHTVEE